MEPKKFTVFIGRFAPFHMGHYTVIRRALELSDKLIMVIGSHNKARNTRDPLTSSERIEIIKASLTEEEQSRIIFQVVPDYPYNLDRWIKNVQSVVFSAIHSGEFIAGPVQTTLIGHAKDKSSYYLKLFPNWPNISVKQDHVLSATDMRHAYYTNGMFRAGLFCSKAAEKLFCKYMDEIYDNQLKADLEYERNYSDDWGVGPHLTADALVVQSGHVLLIQRGQEYGFKRFALPGGFLDLDETLRDCAIRELKEETKIDVPKKVLYGSIERELIYDDPFRSNRARIISQCTYMRLPDQKELPKVKAADDAHHAFWCPLSQVANMQDQFFEDHWSIIDNMVGL